MNSEPLLLATPSGDALELRPQGPWIAANVSTLEMLSRSVGADVDRSRAVTLDMSGISALDTLGAWMLEKLSRKAASSGRSAGIVGVADHFSGLMDEMRQVNRHTPAATAAPNPVLARLSNLGKATIGAREDVTLFLQMLGALFMAVIGVVRRPRTLRLTSLVYQLDRIGWQAIPIVVLITFLIGAIIAQQGFFHFRRFGAESYTVDMVGILVLRELGVLIVAIMVAGRSGSAYTAELGSMKMREEIDALSTMGLDPVEVLILPRVAALVIALPILAFIGSIAALYGGGLVAQYLLYRFNGARLKVPLVFCYRADWGLTMSCTGPRRRISFQRSRKDHHIDLGIEDASPDVSPRYATDLRGLPDTLILSAGYDPLKDEAQAYADQLQRAGTKVRRLRYSETIHGFLRFRGPLEAARTAALEIGTFVRQALGD